MYKGGVKFLDVDPSAQSGRSELPHSDPEALVAVFIYLGLYASRIEARRDSLLPGSAALALPTQVLILRKCGRLLVKYAVLNLDTLSSIPLSAKSNRCTRQLAHSAVRWPGSAEDGEALSGVVLRLLAASGAKQSPFSLLVWSVRDRPNTINRNGPESLCSWGYCVVVGCLHLLSIFSWGCKEQSIRSWTYVWISCSKW